MNMKDYPIVHIYTDNSKGTAGSNKGHGCK